MTRPTRPSRHMLLAMLMLAAGIVPTSEQATYDALLEVAEKGVDLLPLDEFGLLVAEMAGMTQAPGGMRFSPRHERVDRLRERALARWPDLPTRMATGFDDTDGQWMRLLWRALTCENGTGRYGSRHIHGEAVDLKLGIPS
jgi:hypothetical protein